MIFDSQYDWLWGVFLLELSSYFSSLCLCTDLNKNIAFKKITFSYLISLAFYNYNKQLQKSLQKFIIALKLELK